MPFNVKFVPQTSFTAEAWVRPDWTASDPQAWKIVLDMRDFNPGTGFALFAKTDDNQPGVYRWAGIIGTGLRRRGITVIDSDGLPITLGGGGMPVDPIYLALTYDARARP